MGVVDGDPLAVHFDLDPLDRLGRFALSFHRNVLRIDKGITGNDADTEVPTGIITALSEIHIRIFLADKCLHHIVIIAVVVDIDFLHTGHIDVIVFELFDEILYIRMVL